MQYLFIVLILICTTGRLFSETCGEIDRNTAVFEVAQKLEAKGFPKDIASRMSISLDQVFLQDVLKRATPHIAYRGVGTEVASYNPSYGGQDSYSKLYISSHLQTATDFAIKSMNHGNPGIILKFIIPNFFKGSSAVHVFTRKQFPDDRIFLTDIGIVSKEGSNPATGAAGEITWVSYQDAVNKGYIEPL